MGESRNLRKLDNLSVLAKKSVFGNPSGTFPESPGKVQWQFAEIRQFVGFDPEGLAAWEPLVPKACKSGNSVFAGVSATGKSLKLSILIRDNPASQHFGFLEKRNSEILKTGIPV